MLGFVLAGGAARGAYQAGVLRFIVQELLPRLGDTVWPQVVSGTSVGALNGAFAASHDPRAILRLSELWRHVVIDDVYRVSGSNVLRVLRSLVSPVPGVALLDPTPLYGLVAREHPLPIVHKNIEEGRVRAFIVSATQLETGANELFVDSGAQLSLRPAGNTRVNRTRITARHLLASAALPLLFPPVHIGDNTYVDGGLRANTPLRPVIRAGVRRALILGAQVQGGQTAALHAVTPTLPFLAGKTLNALMMDPVARDLAEAEMVNSIARWGAARYGDDFVEAMGRECGVHPVRTLFLRPSMDLGRAAATSYLRKPPDADASVRRLLDFIVDKPNLKEGESDMLSYLYFDHSFTEEIEDLGFEDARHQEEALASLLSDAA